MINNQESPQHLKQAVLPKKIVALKLLVQRSLTQLEALGEYGETCLHTTISDLTHRHGLCFDRHKEPHKNRAGGIAYFNRYTLRNESKGRAHELLQHYQSNSSPRDR